jgi:hypothetical protein
MFVERIRELGNSTWNCQIFKKTVKNLLQNDHVDVNTESSDGYTLLSSVCWTKKMSDHNQHDVIIFLLEMGADPNRGQVLHWVIRNYYRNKFNEIELKEWFPSYHS